MIKVSTNSAPAGVQQANAEAEVDRFRKDLGPFVVAAESTRMPMIFTDPHQDGDPIVFANEAFLRLTEYGLEEVLGKPFASVIEDSHEQERLDWFSPDSPLVLDGQVNLPCRRKSGIIFIASVFTSAVPDSEGVIQQYFSSFIDISERYEALIRANEKHLSLYTDAPGFIATTQGKDHRFTYVNKSYLRLIERDQVVGRTVADVLPEMREQGVLAALDEVYSSGKPFFGRGMRVDLERGAGHEPRHTTLTSFTSPCSIRSAAPWGSFLKVMTLRDTILLSRNKGRWKRS